MTKASLPRDVLVAGADLRAGFNPIRSLLGLLRVRPLELRAFKPKLDVKERPDVYLIRADLPGVKAQDVDVLLSHKRIRISGKREEENPELAETRFESERRYGKFSRTLLLPPEVDISQCQADLRNGVLTLELPKLSAAVMRKIPVKTERARP